MEGISKRIRTGRVIYLALAVLFGVCVTIQVFLAGMASFVHPMNWMKHMTFAHLFGFNLPLFLFIFAYVGALPRWAYWQLLGVLISVFLMYFTANIASELPWLAAMHPVMGILLFMLSYSMVIRAWRFVFDNKNQQKREKI